RIALQSSESDAHLILSEDNAAARLLTRPGEAIYNDANGTRDGNSPFQVAWLGDDERDEHLRKIADLSRAHGITPGLTVVFEGNVPADPSQNSELGQLIEAAAVGATPPRIPVAWVGDAVAITGPAQVAFAPQTGSN